MNDFNPYAAPETPIVEPTVKPTVPQTYRQAVKQGAWFGFKWISILIGPFALLALIVVWGGSCTTC